MLGHSPYTRNRKVVDNIQHGSQTLHTQPESRKRLRVKRAIKHKSAKHRGSLPDAVTDVGRIAAEMDINLNN